MFCVLSGSCVVAWPSCIGVVVHIDVVVCFVMIVDVVVIFLADVVVDEPLLNAVHLVPSCAPQ